MFLYAYAIIGIGGRFYMRKGQGSLEYLIIVAAVLAVAAIVIMFLTGAIGSSRDTSDVGQCRIALTNVYNEQQAFGGSSATTESACEEACADFTDAYDLCTMEGLTEQNIANLA